MGAPKIPDGADELCPKCGCSMDRIGGYPCVGDQPFVVITGCTWKGCTFPRCGCKWSLEIVAPAR